MIRKTFPQKACSHCGISTRSKRKPPLCSRCQEPSKEQRWQRGVSNERALATDEQIAALAALAEQRLPLGPGRRERDEPRRLSHGTGKETRL